MYVQIASGTNANYLTIPQYDDQIAEGQKGLLRMSFVAPISQSLLTAIKQGMDSHGVHGARVTQEGSTVDIQFQKGLPPLVIIIPILLAIITTLAIILISWKIFKEVVPAGLQGTIGTGVIVAGILVVGAIAYRKLRG